MMLVLAYLTLISCGGNDDDSIGNEPHGTTTSSDYYLGPNDILFQQVVGTWKLSSKKEYDKQGNLISHLFPNNIITLSSEKSSMGDGLYQAQLNGNSYFQLSDYKSYYYWYIKRPDWICASHSMFLGTIIDIASNGFTVRWDKDDGTYTIYILERISGSGNNGTTNGNKPEFTNFTYSATQTSITVKFYTDEKANSATIKYGTSSPTSTVSTTISNKQISATITGLKKGTKYYVNCTARNNYGSATSDTYPVITNY